MVWIKRVAGSLAAFIFYVPPHPADEAGKTDEEKIEDMWFWAIR